MKPRRNKTAATGLTAAAALLAGVALWPAAGQDAESLLPPGFGDPAPPAAAPAAPVRPQPGAPADLLPPVAIAPPEEAVDAEEETRTDEELAAEAAELELPDAARRPIDFVGVLDESWGLPADAWGNANGRFLAGLMRRIDAPVASRWEQILLRRALLSRVATPAGVSPQDWIAERAWLLLRMGEADAARMLIQRVDVDRYNPRLLEIAAQVALATSDPAGLCPLTGAAAQFSREPIWPMAQAICAALSGEAAVSSALIDHARDRNGVRGIDGLLAEKVIGAGSNGRRAVTIEWTGVDRLTSWRFGLASAVNVPIPDALFDTVGPQVRAWQARAPMLAPADRATAARTAAALGVLSSAGLVDLYGAIGDTTDEGDIADSDAGRLRRAYAGEDISARITAMRALWDKAKPGRDRYAASILTARAAARVPVSADRSQDAVALIAAMLSAGLDVQAARWAPIVAELSGEDAERAWAMLAVGSAGPAVDLSAGRVEDFVDAAGVGPRAQVLVAALAGLGRLAPADAARLGEAAGVALGRRDRWTEALDVAARSRQQATVALIVAAGMQTSEWRGVHPAQLFHMIAALRRVGLDGEARMIAAEAMSRL